MKKTYRIWTVAAATILAVGLVIAYADDSMHHGWRHHRGPLGFISHELNLSKEQKAQIKTIWQGEEPTVASLLRELASENKEMNSATAQGFDAGKVQSIADRQAATLAKLLVEKEKMKSQIYANVLDAGQRSKADKLQERWSSHLDRMANRLAEGDAHSN